MVAIDRILCPVDFSDVSRHALQHAAALARWYDAHLTALYVFTPALLPPVMLPSPDLLGAVLPTDASLHAFREQLAGWLGGLGTGLRADAMVEQGPATLTILERAETLRANLLVIGTHGHSGFDRLVLGSVTEKVLRKATCPVMTVPPPAATPHALPFKRLLCAVDFSAPSGAAVRYALSLARESNARLDFVHVLEWPEDGDLVDIDTELQRFRQFREEQAQRRLDALVSEEDRTWCQPTTMLAHGRAWTSILGVAERAHADLIVMGVHGRNAVDLTVFGSTTNQVVRRAPCPVLTLRQ